MGGELGGLRDGEKGDHPRCGRYGGGEYTSPF